MTRCQRCFGDLSEFAVFCPNCAQVHEPDLSQLLNQTVGERYKLYRRLGHGGLSTVFAATDLQSDNIVVVKVSDPAQLVRRELTYAIDAEAAHNYWQEMLERMRHEAEALTGIDHPNIVRFFDTGMIGDDLRFVVMEFLRGRMLREELDERGRLETAEAANVALQLCDALGEVHSRGIVHRDLSPRNVMLEEQAKLIDFGIAKFPQPPGAPPFTQHSVLSGTVAYASPEQCQSRPVDHRSDIYSLGVMLYEMLTGERPFTGRTPTEIAIKHLQAQPQPPRQLNPAIPSNLEKTILRALAKAPDDRQQSVQELAEQLRSATRQVIIPLATEIAPELESSEATNQHQPFRRRRRRLAVAAVLLLGVFAAGIWGKNWLASHALPLLTGAFPVSSPTPEGAIVSDSDSLELAAQLPADSLPPASAIPPAQSAAVSSGAANKALIPSTRSAETVKAPQPTPVVVKQAPQSTAQAPSKPEERKIRQRDSEDSASVTRPNSSREEPAATRDRVVPARNRDDITVRNDSSDDDGGGNQDGRGQHESDSIGPKLIQWSGRVKGEREVLIDLPGSPGTLEIPRAYRNRVGIIEPPSASNRWRCARLRVFGEGGVSFVVRWWPTASQLTKLAGQ
ncbi:MAG: serine/threonine protein kinase [Blastocatellia bacterium]